jgi:hypothetical protein
MSYANDLGGPWHSPIGVRAAGPQADPAVRA